MSTTVNKIGAFIVGLSTLLPLSCKQDTQAQTPADNKPSAVKPLSAVNNKQFSEEHKQYIRDHFWSPFVASTARDPRFRVEQKDIDFAMTEAVKSSPFSGGLTQNPTFPITEANIKFARENFTSSFAIGLIQNERYVLQDEDVKIARENIDSAYAYYTTKKSTYKIERQDKEIAWSSPRSRFATGLAENENYLVEPKDKEIARKDPHSNFAASVAKNKTYRVEKEDIEIARRKVDTEFTYHLVQKPSYQVTSEDIETARREIHSYFAQIAINPNYLKGHSKADIQKDIDIALKNTDSIFAAELFSNPALKLTAEHIEMIKKEPLINTELTEAIAQNPNYPVTEANIKLALDNPNSWYSSGLMQNPAFPLAKHWDHIKANFNTMLAYGYGQNPKLEITNDVYNFAQSSGDSALFRGLIQHPEYNNAGIRVYHEFVQDILGIKGKAGDVTNVTDGTFDTDVLKATQPVLVDFWAPWCGPCLRLAPVVDDVSKTYGGSLKVLKLNTDENPKTSDSFNINSIPRLLLFKEGKLVGTIGGRTKVELMAELNKHLKLK